MKTPKRILSYLISKEKDLAERIKNSPTMPNQLIEERERILSDLAVLTSPDSYSNEKQSEVFKKYEDLFI